MFLTAMLLIGLGWSIGVVCGFYYGEWYAHNDTKVGTPSASHNKRMVGAVSPQICPTCNGHGEYTSAGGGGMNLETCSRCKGSGKLS